MTASKRQVQGSHYRDFAIQPSEYIYANKLSWPAGNIIKYASRAGKKGGREGMAADLRKIIHYAELWLEWEYPDDGASHEPTREVPCDHVRDGLDPGLLSGVGRQGCPECDEP